MASGYGAVMRTTGVEPSSRCAVFGLGGVGLSAVMACKLAGARQIVGIDVASNKFEAGTAVWDLRGSKAKVKI